MVEDTQWSEKAIFYIQSVVDIVAAGITSSININLFNTHARSTVHREEQLLLSNWGGSVSWTTHSGGQTLRCRSKAFREIKWIYIRKSHLWPLIPHHETHQLQCSSLAQMKTHYHHLFKGENVTSSLSFTSGGGLHRRTAIAYWLRESTLECFHLNLSLHTWCKVIGSTRVRTQHCTFSRDRMVHSRH